MPLPKSLLAYAGSAGLLTAAAVLFQSSPAPVQAAGPVVAGPLASAVVAQEGAYGTIKGRLVYGGDKVPEPAPANVNRDQNVCGKNLKDPSLVVDPSTKGISWGIVYINAPKGKNAAAEKALLGKKSKMELDQKACEFIPHAMAMHKAQAIVFKSSDPVGHNVRYSGFSNAAQNFTIPPNGVMEKKLVAENRPIPVVCDIHPWMKANLMVFDHPFFAVTNHDGSFEITGVPAGTQKIVIWQEKVGYVNAGGKAGQPVEVKAGGVTDLGDVKLDPAKIK